MNQVNRNPTEYKTLLPIAQKYDYFLLDLWGVIHDGDKLYPGAKEAIENLYLMGKHIVFVSNAIFRNEVVIEQLTSLGIPRELYTGVISSGEVLHRQCKAAEKKQKYFYVGSDIGHKMTEGTGFEHVTSAREAKFFLANSPVSYDAKIEEIMPQIREALEAGLPLLCPNPDRVVHRQSGESRYCPGAIADVYREMGGQTYYIGKPYAAIYKIALSMFGDNIDKSKVVMIDDGLPTGITGANRMGIDSVLVLGGILQIEKLPLEEVLKKANTYPTATLPKFSFTEPSLAAGVLETRNGTGERIV